MPHSPLIDRQGRIAHYWSGAVDPGDVAAEQALGDTILALHKAPAR